MASIKSAGYSNPQYNRNDGSGAFVTDKVVLTANPSVGDTLDFILKAGVQLCTLQFAPDDLDSNGTPTFAFSAGYAPVDPASTLAAVPAYFAAAGQTNGQTGTLLNCKFKPIVFNEDVHIRLTVGAASATFVAGEVHMIAGVNCVGTA